MPSADFVYGGVIGFVVAVVLIALLFKVAE